MAAAATTPADIEMGGLGGESKEDGGSSRLVMPKFMTSFFRAVEEIKKDLQQIRKSAKDIDQLTEIMMRSVSSSSSNDEASVGDKLAKIMSMTQAKIKGIKAKLEAMKTETGELRRDEKLQAQELRIRDNLHKALHGKFISAVDLYKTAQQRYSTELKGKVKRQVMIVVPEADDQFVDKVMASEGGVKQLYEQVITKSAATGVKAAYDQAVEQYDQVKRLEQAVAEVAQMFVDMALLVDQQGDMLDSIEQHVINAKERTGSGNADLEASITYQKSIRNKQCCVTVIVLVIGAIIIMNLMVP
eukprot:FR738650.1.p1 GENE.FR738650.1~~FR738650.1.p1  ORF type:complete len:301 (+),score=55.60 FR738650.1:17-919(+)